MPKYRIYRTEIIAGFVEVEADTEEQAYNNSAEEDICVTDETTIVNAIKKIE